MIAQAALWWFLASLLGLIASPVLWRLFHRLPERGYGFSKVVGLFGVGFTLWFGASIGIFKNDFAGILGCLVILGILSYFVIYRHLMEWWTWIKQNKRTILIFELVFLGFYAFWVVVRSYNPEIQATEKPMELGFINAILRSESFPPKDPWLSGHAISYYYFGYVLIAILTRLSGVTAGVSFNLANALWFGLTAIGSYSLVFNFSAILRKRTSHTLPFLGPIFLLISGNLEGFFEVLWARRFFWKQLPDGTFSSGFWNWLDIKDLVRAPTGDPAWISDRNWWWWRASRVVRDLNFREEDIEVIDEFPFFSFLLADNHPHLLALPFALLAIAFALNLFLGGKREPRPLRDPQNQVREERIFGAILVIAFVGGLLNAILSFNPDEGVLSALQGFGIPAIIAGILVVLGFFIFIHLGSYSIYLNFGELWFGAWLFGGLAFLNTWDSPVYFLVFAAALWWTCKKSGSQGWLSPFLMTLGAIIIGAVILFLPWLPTFSSQAGGVLPNLPFPTKPQHFLVMFGTIFIPVFWWMSKRHPVGNPFLHMLLGLLLASFAWTGEEATTGGISKVLIISVGIVGIGIAIWGLIRVILRSSGFRGIAYMLGIPFGLFLASWILAGVVVSLDETISIDILLSMLGTDDLRFAINETLLRRVQGLWVPLALGGVLALSILQFFPVDRESEAQPVGQRDLTQLFVVILIAIGGLLILTPEYIYLRDLFGTRMNTIFKFYYSAWVLWGLAAAVAIVELIPSRVRFPDGLQVLLLLPLMLGLIYPIIAIQTKTNQFQSMGGPTLDGIEYLSRINPDDYNAILWINSLLPDGVISEAVGGSYSPSHARISAHTGFPTVLGWDFHEVQWRGESSLLGTRRSDIELLYKTPDWTSAKNILDLYEIDYVYVGPVERRDYQPLSETKFERFMDLIYQSGEVKIYARRD